MLQRKQGNGELESFYTQKTVIPSLTHSNTGQSEVLKCTNPSLVAAYNLVSATLGSCKTKRAALQRHAGS